MADQFKTGTQDGTGASIDIQLGWVPDYVIVQNHEAADFARLQWFKGMTAGHAIKTVTSTNSLITSLGITQLSAPTSGGQGFRIGADTDVNVSGEALTWCAFRNAP
ncbi:MAG TPA: hypothetical protein VF470_04380 [Sphingomicrobium sp.]